MFFFSFIVAAAVLYYHWEAMLVSYLSARKIKLPFRSVEELLSNSGHKIILRYGSASEHFFQHNPNLAFQKAYTERILPYKDKYNDLGSIPKLISLQEVMTGITLNAKSDCKY